MADLDECLRGDPWPPGLARALERHLAPEWAGAPVVFLAETGSTNDVARQAALAGAADGTCVLARSQTAGRGRRGRVWVSPAGSGLYFSAVIRPPGGADAPSPDDHSGPAMLITLMAAVAVVDALRVEPGFTATIKWPNDIIVERRSEAGTRLVRRKLGGILVEGSVANGRVEHAVVGIGLNVAPGAYPPEVDALATNLEAETCAPVDAHAVFAACRAALARERARLFAGGGADLLRLWRERAPSAEGVRVAWQESGRRHTGVTAGLSPSGALVVRDDETGEATQLVAGEVEWA